jgi:hypothetical protein
MYKLDRSAFKINSFKEADNTYSYWMLKSADERFAAAWYLISCAWDFDINNPPRMDKTFFLIRKNDKY